MVTSHRIYCRGRHPVLCSLLLIAILCCAVGCAVGSSGNEGVPEGAVSVPVTFDSHGRTLHGVFYPAATDAPIATVLLLHGYPGNDKEALGLGSRMMEEGINVLAFNYRGTWASEGSFTVDNALEDVDSAISYLSSPDVAEKNTIDPDNLIVVGYSFGGNMALISSSQHPSIKRVAAIAGANLSEIARSLEINEAFRSSWTQMIDETMSESGPARGEGGAAAYEWLLENRDRFDFVAAAGELAGKDLLLLGGWLDRQVTVEGHILPLYRALQQHQAKNVVIEVFSDDHDFKVVRDALADRIISWIKGEVSPES